MYLYITAHKISSHLMIFIPLWLCLQIKFTEKEVWTARESEVPIFIWKLIKPFLFHPCIIDCGFLKSYALCTPPHSKSGLYFQISTNNSCWNHRFCMSNTNNPVCYKTSEFHKLNFIGPPRSIYYFDTQISDGAPCCVLTISEHLKESECCWTAGFV